MISLFEHMIQFGVASTYRIQRILLHEYFLDELLDTRYGHNLSKDDLFVAHKRGFSVPKFDVFPGAATLSKSSSKHDPKIIQTCNNTVVSNVSKASPQCCKRVMFVGLGGKFATILRKFPFIVKCPNQIMKAKSNVNTCTVVVDHVDVPMAIASADLVVFTHIGGYMSLNLWRDLLRYKHENQRWVFSTIESAIYVRGLLPPWNLRNETYDYADTFLSHTDVTTVYGSYQPFQIGKPKGLWNGTDHLAGKKRLISWTASHCETLQWNRKRFVNDLESLLSVDTYGKCGKLSICSATWKADCSLEFDNLMKTYKFGLALENSCCNEYITEKFWNMLTLGTVPVVIGPPLEDLVKLAPPNSFVHADQFESMDEMAEYLLYLDGNDTAYKEYFTWKRKGQIQQDTTPDHYKRAVSDGTICQLMTRLQEDSMSSKKGIPSTPFNVYSSSWEDTCVSCGRHRWLKDYEYSPDHMRKSSSLWA
ncbi:putative glycoprotein 3-alpha-L-fucosyltransferase A-like [Apostichopus japonicus]|uniref:Fucosyltransferase n=1 Tax=Stichopus japonicus TaxID=307972 RepID=A0A2G8LFF5_STIJA|nr:putative glycoprotein 3-alpha-L-fucosyltransferase A-like [Apostichopus japonicus]